MFPILNNRRTVEVFISYAHEDEELRGQLEKHLASLRTNGLIRTWNDRKIIAGGDWHGDIDENLKSADIILLLISADFLNSRYCNDVEIKGIKLSPAIITVCPKDASLSNPPNSRVKVAAEGVDLNNPNYRLRFSATAGTIEGSGSTAVWDITGVSPGGQGITVELFSFFDKPGAVLSALVSTNTTLATIRESCVTPSTQETGTLELSFQEGGQNVNLNGTGTQITLEPLFDVSPLVRSRLSRSFNAHAQTGTPPGTVIFNGLPPGRYTLHVRSPQFQNLDKTISINSGINRMLMTLLQLKGTLLS